MQIIDSSEWRNINGPGRKLPMDAQEWKQWLEHKPVKKASKPIKANAMRCRVTHPDGRVFEYDSITVALKESGGLSGSSRDYISKIGKAVRRNGILVERISGE